MVVYALYIFNKHSRCVHRQKWEHNRQPAKELSEEEEEKLIYGVVFSLKGLVKKVAGNYSDSEQFQSIKTSKYRLHVFESQSNFKFILMTDQNTTGMASHLHAIYAGPFNGAVVRNPLVGVDGVVTNDKLCKGIEGVLRGLK
ncbi:hypothetical protein E3P92_00217 [Wallemia ichthyophaga]|uniref:Trafficking protein particle complex subunit n=1 Tax=Wallemia ichthyophaga TaxID=245174 RepID=A0A4T0JC68_WALIC|nr:hypothetical protein E3P91_00493 [Wallemia ichthyophaga]TIA84108.1 hypothetical protein E3P98_00361 [Wallemia ichthyophaga]TIB00719.1 hypothetical protein E3P95_01571 [Wallemia ichthyophaga]TIB01001.1 hypothetical protein E3P94_01957 [Wallemia ichthyophaga]TIB16361.1 hypothetical protein E3P90_00505 [Wallemia ichthyophaga]